MIDVLYFASLREALGSNRERISHAQLDSVAALKQALVDRGGPWAEVFSQDNGVLVSVNHAMASDRTALNDGDEVAFFPPVTGG